jgi:uncharacterized protein (TIGR03435 family)
MHDLADGLSRNELFVDETGIEGIYDFDVVVKYPLDSPTAIPDESSTRQAEFQSYTKAAFEKQIGLIVDYGTMVKRPVSVLIVDHVELPTPN